MPIRPPALDDRRFDDLVAELIARIPAHTPEWTNPQPGDPGRTLLELVAWLGDTILYRANLIPERQRLAFLRLLGMPLRPAVPARGLVALDVAAIKARVELAPGSVIDKPLPFATQQHCTALPLAGRAFIKRALSADEARQVAPLLPELTQLYRLDSTAQARPYVTTEVYGGTAVDPAGIDLAVDAVDRALWIALMAPDARSVAAARRALERSEGQPIALNVGLAPGLQADATLDVPAPSGAGRLRIPTRWEITTGAAAAESDGLLTLEVAADSTDGLAQDGVVRLLLPDAALIGAPDNDPRSNLTAGVGLAPPRLDTPEDAARLIAWLRCSAPPQANVTRLRLSWAAINAVDIVQTEALPARVLGVSDGGSDQSFDLGLGARGSVLADTFDIAVDDPVAERLPWTAVDDLGRCGPLDNAYQLDAEAGVVRFGDGVHGRVPSAGSQIIARGRRGDRVDPRGFSVGGGVGGNLPAGALTRLAATLDPVTGMRKPLPGSVKVVQLLPTRGGAAAETVALAEKRIPGFLVHRERAVTAADYRALAQQTPGAEVGRVEVLPRFKPQERQGDIPGVVSMMVLPARASVDFAAPYPRADRPLIEAVHAHLDARRPLATELYVIGCEYKALGIGVAVRVRDGHAREQVLAEVRLAVRRWLWPLPLGTDGSAGDWPAGAASGGGYPLGRSLTDRELEVVVARVAGVAGVSPVRLFELREDTYLELPGAGKAVTTFALAAWQLPELTALVVTEGNEAPATLGAPPEDPARDVHVPVVPELC